MKARTLGLQVSGTVFAFMGLVQLARLLTRFEVVIAGHPMPLWLNGVVFLITGGLSAWMWKLASYAPNR